MKRIISLLLAVLLCASLAGVGVLAASEEPDASAAEGETLSELETEASDELTEEPGEPIEEIALDGVAEAEPAAPNPLPDEEETAAVLDGAGRLSGAWNEYIDWSFENGVMTFTHEDGADDDGSMGPSGRNVGEKPWGINSGFHDEDVVEAVIGEGITDVSSALQDCVNLKKVTLASSVKTIRSYAFDHCNSLATVVYDGDVAALTVEAGNEIFLLAAGIQIDLSGATKDGLSWSLRDTTLTISGAGAMQETTVPVEIPGGDFWERIQYPWESAGAVVRTLVIGDGVTSVALEAFQNFSKLEAVTLPVSLAQIEKSAFSGCDALKTVTYGGSQNDWNELKNNISSGNGALLAAAPYPLSESGTFGDNDALTWSLQGTTLTIGGTGDMPEEAQPWNDYADVIDTLVVTDGVTGVGWLGETPRLKSVTLADSVESIAESTFHGCEKLTSITLPANLKEIGFSAFANTGLTRIDLPRSLTSIGEWAFGECSSMTAATYAGTEDDWLKIEIGAYNDNLWELLGFHPRAEGTLGDLYWKVEDGTLTVWGEGAMPEKVTYDEDDVDHKFGNYELPPWEPYIGLIDKIVVKDGVTSVCACAFGARKVTDVTLPDTVKTIGNSAFSGCDALESIKLPSKLESIGDYAFAYCKELRSIELPDTVTELGEFVFLLCTELVSAKLPDGLEHIPDTAFIWCFKLTNVNLPAALKTIGSGAFEECAITSVRIPTSVTEIGQGAFYACKSLRSIYYAGDQAAWDAITIASGNDRLGIATLYFGFDTDAAVTMAVDNAEQTEELLTGVAQSIAAGTASGVTTDVTAAALQAKIDNGEPIGAQVVAAALGDGAVSAADAEKIAEIAGEDDILTNVDLSLRVTADGQPMGGISELDEEIPFSLSLSDDQLERLDNGELYVIRVHNGEAEKLDVTRSGGSVSFKSNSFSTYAVAATKSNAPAQDNTDHSDPAAGGSTRPNDAGNGDNKSGGTRSTGTTDRKTSKTPAGGATKTGDAPKTGDETAILPWIIVLGVCVVGAAAAIVIILVRKKNKKQ